MKDSLRFIFALTSDRGWVLLKECSSLSHAMDECIKLKDASPDTEFCINTKPNTP